MTWQALLAGLPETTEKLLTQFVNSRKAYITLQTEFGQVLTEHGVTFDNVDIELTARGVKTRALVQPLPFHVTPLNPRVGWDCTVKLDEAPRRLLDLILTAIRQDHEAQERASLAKPRPQTSEVDLSLLEYPAMVGDVELRQGDSVYHGTNRMPFVALTRVRKLNDPVGYLRVAPLEPLRCFVCMV